MQHFSISYVGGPLDDQVVSVTGKNRPPILNARAFTHQEQERIALYARHGDEGAYSYQFVNAYALDEWQSQEKDLATALAATLLPWGNEPPLDR